jgi:hypothetical protein
LNLLNLIFLKSLEKEEKTTKEEKIEQKKQKNPKKEKKSNEEISRKSKIIKKEERIVGKLETKLYKEYLLVCGGKLMLFFILLLVVLETAARMGSDFWISVWSDDPYLYLHPFSFYLSFYAFWVFMMSWIVLGRSYARAYVLYYFFFYCYFYLLIKIFFSQRLLERNLSMKIYYIELSKHPPFFLILLPLGVYLTDFPKM